jgi:hypothetical protein
MKFSVDDAAKEALRKSLQEKNKSAVRVAIQGFG